MMCEVKTELGLDDWSDGTTIKTEPMSPTGFHILRPQERQLMRPWLWDRLEKRDVPGMFWVDKEKLHFRIPWKHGSRQGWEQSKDAVLFRMWAEHTGKFRLGDDRCVQDPKTWKATFRCALNSLPDVKEVPGMSEKKGTNAYRVYCFMEPKRTRKNSRSSDCGLATKKTTRRMSVKREPGFGSPTPSLKRTFAEMDSADDAASDTTDSGSEDIVGELTKKLKAETTTFCNIQDNAPSFCTCGTEEPLPKRDSGAQSDSKEKNRQALLRYLQNKDVRKALAQSLQQQGRMDLLRQKYLATEQWVTAQQQTTVTSIPPQNITEKISLTGFSPEEDFLSSTSSKKTYSIVDELVQRCRDGKRSPLPAVETLTRSTQFGSHVTFPAYNLQQYFDQCGDTTPAPAAAHQSLPRALSPPRAPAMVSPPRCAQPPTAAAAAQVPVAHAAPSYFTVTAAKQNQVLITPPASSTADSPPCSKTDRDTSSPDSGLSDENVVSMVDDMLKFNKQTVLNAAPIEFIPVNPVENASFCQLFSSSSQLLLANSYSQA